MCALGCVTTSRYRRGWRSAVTRACTGARLYWQQLRRRRAQFPTGDDGGPVDPQHARRVVRWCAGGLAIEENTVRRRCRKGSLPRAAGAPPDNRSSPCPRSWFARKRNRDVRVRYMRRSRAVCGARSARTPRCLHRRPPVSRGGRRATDVLTDRVAPEWRTDGARPTSHSRALWYPARGPVSHT